MAFSDQSRRFARLESLHVNFSPARFVGRESQPPAVRRERRIGFVKRSVDEMNYLSIPGHVDQPYVAVQLDIGCEPGIGICDETAVR